MNIVVLRDRLSALIEKLPNPEDIVVFSGTEDRPESIDEIKVNQGGRYCLLEAPKSSPAHAVKYIPKAFSEVVSQEQEGNYVKLTLECGCTATRHMALIARQGMPKKMKCLGQH